MTSKSKKTNSDLKMLTLVFGLLTGFGLSGFVSELSSSHADHGSMAKLFVVLLIGGAGLVFCMYKELSGRMTALEACLKVTATNTPDGE